MRVGIVGLGLIGGSLGLALRRLAQPPEVIGIARSPERASAAMQRGAIDAASADIAGLGDCDIVVLATPIDQIRTVLERAAAVVGPDTVVTDVASIKVPIVEWARRIPHPQRFFAGHPVAGKAESGLEAADPALFADEPWIFTPAPGQDRGPLVPVVELVSAIGARPVFMGADEHDRQMAYLSHLAFTVSAAYAQTIEAHADPTVGGPGYRSMVRLARGDASMYESILAQNRRPLVEALDVFAQTLHDFRERIAREQSVRDLFKAGTHVAV